ncbi:MAG: twin-arginine translocase TatA/TatE family subunit [Alphaproteobacteria bacterium]
MFGISATEFLVILLVAICVVPAKYWPEVARFLARIVKYIRNILWKITDFSENLQQRIDLEKPIDDLITNATNDMFGEKIKKNRKKNVVKKVRKK